MKTAAVSACLFVAGAFASFAVAKPTPVKGKHHRAVAAKAKNAARRAGRVTLCHKVGSKRRAYVLVRVSGNSVKAHLKKGDVEPATDGSCPKPAAAVTATTTEERTEADAPDAGTESEEASEADETTTEADDVEADSADSADSDDLADSEATTDADAADNDS